MILPRSVAHDPVVTWAESTYAGAVATHARLLVSVLKGLSDSELPENVRRNMAEVESAIRSRDLLYQRIYRAVDLETDEIDPNDPEYRTLKEAMERTYAVLYGMDSPVQTIEDARETVAALHADNTAVVTHPGGVIIGVAPAELNMDFITSVLGHEAVDRILKEASDVALGGADAAEPAPESPAAPDGGLVAGPLPDVPAQDVGDGAGAKRKRRKRTDQ